MSDSKGWFWYDWYSVSPVILYNNSSGTTDTVTLSETAANFTFIEIYGCLADGVLVPLGKAINPNGKTIDMVWLSTNSSNAALLRNRVKISGTSITQSNNRQVIFNATNFNAYTDDNYLMRICAVVGYR